MNKQRAATYLVAYLVALLWPLVFIAIVHADGDMSFLTAFANSVGFVAMNALALQVIVPSRVKGFTEALGVPRLIRFHRLMGYVAFAFVFVHVAVLVIDQPEVVELFDVRDAPVRAQAGVGALAALVALLFTTWRPVQRRLGYEGWRFLHITLSITLLAGSFTHVVLVAQFSGHAGIRWGTFAMVALAALAIFYLRVVRPFRGGWSPYVLDRVERETATTVTMVLRPDGHAGISFLPGQFAWLKFEHARYSLREHPFSIVSSAVRRDELRFTVREVGDFTSSVSGLRPGTRVLVDGPHGAWRPAPDVPITFVVGGVGITPALSMLATAMDLRGNRSVQVVYACRELEDVIGAQLLHDAAKRPELEVFVVPSIAPPDWRGVSGQITTELLSSVAGQQPADRCWFVCGPPPMRVAVLNSLAALGVPEHHVHIEFI